MFPLGGGSLKVGDKVLPLRRLLESGEHHLGSLDVLLGVEKVLEESVLSPHDAGVLVGGTVAVALSEAGLAAEKTVEVGALLVGSSSLDSVALRAFLYAGNEGGGGSWGREDGEGGGGLDEPFEGEHDYCMMTPWKTP